MDKKENSKVVKTLKKIPVFTATNLMEYGPFEKGQVVTLPEKTAELFISRKLGVEM